MKRKLFSVRTKSSRQSGDICVYASQIFKVVITLFLHKKNLALGQRVFAGGNV